MFRAALTLLRRVITAASLLFLLICGAEVAVRIYETASGTTVCQSANGICSDPSKLTIPSWSIHQELKPSATARVECRDSKTEIEFQTNSRGLRGAEPVVPKPPNVCRIVVLGDETIFAPETTESEHFCYRLQTELQQHTRTRVEVLNAGIPGHCPFTEFVFFKQRLMGLQPDLVLLHFDWSDVAEDRQIRRLARCDELDIPQSCSHAALISEKRAHPLERWRRQFRLLDWALNSVSLKWKLQVARQRAASHNIDTNPYAWLREEHPEENGAFRQAIKPIVDFANLCRSSNCQFVVMTSPKPWQVSPTCSRGPGVRLSAGVDREAYYSNRAPFNALARFAKFQNIFLIDGSTAIEANFLQHAPRWSPTGHKLIAEYVAKFLVEKVPGTWNGSYSLQDDQPVTRTRPNETDIQWTSGQKPSSK